MLFLSISYCIINLLIVDSLFHVNSKFLLDMEKINVIMLKLKEKTMKKKKKKIRTKNISNK
jgi:hypothetical protein